MGSSDHSGRTTAAEERQAGIFGASIVIRIDPELIDTARGIPTTCIGISLERGVDSTPCSGNFVDTEEQSLPVKQQARQSERKDDALPRGREACHARLYRDAGAVSRDDSRARPVCGPHGVLPRCLASGTTDTTELRSSSPTVSKDGGAGVAGKRGGLHHVGCDGDCKDRGSLPRAVEKSMAPV